MFRYRRRWATVAAIGLLATAGVIGPAGAAHADPAPAWPGTNRGVENLSSGFCLAARSGSSEPPAVQTACDFKAGANWVDQHWNIYVSLDPYGHDDGTYYIYSSFLNKCLGARNTSTEPPVLAVACDFNHNTYWRDQHWILDWILTDTNPGGQYWFQFTNLSLGKCMGARGGAEARVIAVACDYNHSAFWNDQHWILH
jgi:hypothetical protein